MSEDLDAPPTWDDLAALLRSVALLFGGPARMRDKGLVERVEWRRIRGWLVALETIARALLVLLAAALPRQKVRPSGSERAARRGEGAEPCEDPNETAESERWTGVVFHCVPRERSGRGPTGNLSEPRSFLPTQSLARRFEALIRVSEAPERYAARLARRMRDGPEIGDRVLRRAAGSLPSAMSEEVGRAQLAAWRVLAPPAVESG